MARGGAGARPTFAELNPASVRAAVRSGGKYKYHWNACALSEAWKGEGCGRACKNSGFGAALAPEQLSRCLPAAQVPILVGESERVVFWERNKKEKETAAKRRGKKESGQSCFPGWGMLISAAAAALPTTTITTTSSSSSRAHSTPSSSRRKASQQVSSVGSSRGKEKP